jgi:Skp family chaperone for outer membrane proteins
MSGRNILRKRFENVYSNKNMMSKSVNELAGRDPFSNKPRVEIPSTSSNNSSSSSFLGNNTTNHESIFKWLLLILFILIVLVLVYLNSDTITKYLNETWADISGGFHKLMKPAEEEKKKTEEKKNQEEKKPEEKKKTTTTEEKKKGEPTKKQDENKKQDDDLKTLQKKLEEARAKMDQQSKGGVIQLQNRIDNHVKPNEDTSDVASMNAYCFIGMDNKDRQCTEIYKGEICMSGQIFPSMAVCQNPHLRI